MAHHQTGGRHLLFDLVGGDGGADGHPASEMLGDGEDVRHHPFLLEAPHRTQFGQPGLGFIDDQKGPAFLAFALELPQPAIREVDDASGAEQRLGDYAGQLAVGLGVKQIETGVEARVVAAAPVPAEGAAVLVGGDDGVVPRGVGAVALMPTGVRDRPGRVGHAVEAHRRAGELIAAREPFGDGHGRLVGVAARSQEHGAVHAFRGDLGQACGQDYLPVVEHAHVAVNQGLTAFLERLYDAGVIVAQGTAHLTRVKVQVLLSVHVADD